MFDFYGFRRAGRDVTRRRCAGAAPLSFIRHSCSAFYMSVQRKLHETSSQGSDGGFLLGVFPLPRGKRAAAGGGKVACRKN
ncbi:hypothetical protein [Cupriavidus basilensis]|jgi:hypothetical protein